MGEEKATKETAPQAGEEAEALRVRFDIGEMTLDDWALMDEMRLGEEGWKRPGMVLEIVGMLKRCCGEEVGGLHVTDLPELIEQLGQAIQESSAGKN